MYNSTIKRPSCKICGKPPKLGFGGYCFVCCPDEIKNKKLSRTKEVQKAKNERLRIASKLRLIPKNIEGVEKIKVQDDWYKLQQPKMKGKCCNCGSNTQNKDSKFYKWSIAHVLPKNIFKSVAMNDNNWIELCISCHTSFDRNLHTASMMWCFKKAVNKYQQFKDEVTETHKYKTLFEEYANQL